MFESICKQTYYWIKKYNLFKTNDVVIGFSGGKDSRIVMLVLKEFGYNVYPIMVDMGHEKSA